MKHCKDAQDWLAAHVVRCPDCKPLTQPQQNLLDRIRLTGELRMNGRAFKMLKALESRGLITVEWFAQPRLPNVETHIARPI